MLIKMLIKIFYLKLLVKIFLNFSFKYLKYKKYYYLINF